MDLIIYFMVALASADMGIRFLDESVEKGRAGLPVIYTPNLHS